MRRIGTLLSLVGFSLVATAQNPGDPESCQSLSSASRTRTSQCGDEETTVEPAGVEFTVTLDTQSIRRVLCQANLNIEYLQFDTIARVAGVIDHDDCAASGGEYTIRARIRDENGETKTLDFSESWQRNDDQPVSISAEYPIGENVELLRLRSSGLRCECAELDEEREPTPVQ